MKALFAITDLDTITRYTTRLWAPGLASSLASDQLRDHTGQKRRYWLVLKEIIRAAPFFFLSLCVLALLAIAWHGTSKQHFRTKIFNFCAAKLEVGGPAQRLQAAVEQLTRERSTPTLDFFRAISAGE
jgi:hypothetical protein